VNSIIRGDNTGVTLTYNGYTKLSKNVGLYKIYTNKIHISYVCATVKKQQPLRSCGAERDFEGH
jgi:hypothetical protein